MLLKVAYITKFICLFISKPVP